MPQKIAPSVHLVGTDELLFERLMWLLPEYIEIEHHRSLDEVSILTEPPTFTLYQTNEIDGAERRRIERFLLEAPRRLVVLCDRADPSQVYNLSVTGAALGLIAVENNRSPEFLEERVRSWYWGGLVGPDPSAFGASEGEEPPCYVAGLISLVERNPFHRWRVRELAQHLRISTRTLNRAVQSYFGRGTKALLMDLRYQLIRQARRDDHLSWKNLADLFGFESAKGIQAWCRAYEKGRRWR